MDPYPHKFHVSISIPLFLETYNYLEKQQQLEDKKFALWLEDFE